jgi:ankyrin repeat protein
MRGHAASVEALLDVGAQFEIQVGIESMRPLHVASRQGDNVIASMLIEKGADMFARTASQLSPLDLALRAGVMSGLLMASKISRTLFEKNETIAIADGDGNALFHFPNPGSLATYLYNIASQRANAEPANVNGATTVEQEEQRGVGEQEEPQRDQPQGSQSDAQEELQRDEQQESQTSAVDFADRRNEAILSLIRKNQQVFRSVIE